MQVDKQMGSKSVIRCPICDNEGIVLHENLNDRLFGTQGTWSLKKCNNIKCLLIWLDPMPNKDEIWKAYANYYTHEDSKSNILPFLRPLEQAYFAQKYEYKNGTNLLNRWFSLIFYLFPTERAEIDIRMFYLKACNGAKLLDVGCGDGSLIARLVKNGWDVAGIDFDEKAVAYCISRGLNVRTGDLLSQHFPESCFDVIILNHVIEHLFDPKEVLQECNRILKSGGKIAIATPNSRSWIYNWLFKQNWFSLDPPRHLMIYNRRNLSNVLLEAGFAISKSETTIRNDFYVYTGSKAIKKKGYFAMGKERLNKIHVINGKILQLLGWFLLFFNKDSGGEVHIEAIKL